MKLLNYIPSWLFNKYLITVTCFLVWMFFFDPKDIPSDLNRRDKYRELQRNEAHLNQLIIQTQDELAQLKTNAQSIEKYAREKYQMKKDNEDLFIVASSSLTNK